MREMKNNGGKKWWAFWKKTPAEEGEEQPVSEQEASATEESEGEDKEVNLELAAEKPAEGSREEAEREAPDGAAEAEEGSASEDHEEASGENPDLQIKEENTGENPESEENGGSAPEDSAAEKSSEAGEKESTAEENTGMNPAAEEEPGEKTPEISSDVKEEAGEENTGVNPAAEEEPGEESTEISTDEKDKSGEESTEISPDEKGEPGEKAPETSLDEKGESGEENKEPSPDEKGEPGEKTPEISPDVKEEPGEGNPEINQDAEEAERDHSETEEKTENSGESQGTEQKEEVSEGSGEHASEEAAAGGEEPQPADLVKDNGNGLDHDLSAEEREEEEREKADQAAYEARRQIRMARLQRRKRKRKIQKAVCTVVLLLAALVAAGAGGIYLGYIKPETVQSVVAVAGNMADTVKEKISSINFGKGSSGDEKTDVYNVLISEETGEVDLNRADSEDGEAAEVSGQAANSEGLSEETESQDYQPTTEDLALLEQAEYLAAQYSYTDAILLLKNSRNFEQNEDMRAAVREYRKLRKSCVSWPLDEVTHVFYHTLIKDTAKAFDGDFSSGNYNQVMTTIDEFNKITQSMYDRGYVMVSIYDLAKVNGDGSMTSGKILLPPGKIPFVLSQDDVSYYHYMDGDGFASRLIVDEEGKVRNEYLEDDGSVTVGDFDVVPLIDRFVEQHPDFSYHGAKGIVALTGYDGILGYRTDSSYETRPDDLDDDKRQWLDAHPDFSLEEERAGAKKVADAMRQEGWLFASHTWGHKNVGEASLERLMTDTEQFKENVDPLIGGTDIIIFAFGTDLTSGEEYSGEKFEYFKGQGYNYFCNVDSSRYFVRIGPNYLRMGRRNLDGYRMYYNPDMLEDLFDVGEVFDSSRPTPVPAMG